MNISFGKSAYVPGTPDELLDTMENSPLSITTTGDGMVIVTMESLQEFIRNYENDMAEYQKRSYKDLYDFIQKAIDSINKANDGTPIGDIFFVS